VSTVAKTYKALADGYVDNVRIKPGDVFTTSAPKGKWMEEVTETKPALKKVVKASED
jgi:hypothetical protein